MSKPTTVIEPTAAEIRVWGVENVSKLTPAAAKSAIATRGRLHTELVDAYLKSHKGAVYAPNTGAPATPTTFEFAATVLDKIGRRRSKNVTMTVPEVREMMGAEGKRGRLPKLDTIAAAWQARYDNSVADQFVTDAA